VLEFAIASYYSPNVIDIRPSQADAILPKNNPKLADQKLGAAVFQEIQILRFLGNTAAVNRHEAVLKFITDRKNVTRAEVEAFYRNGIRALISDIVDEAAKLALARSEVKLPNNSIQEIKQMFTNFYLSPNQKDYNSIMNYSENREALDKPVLERIERMNTPNPFQKILLANEVRLVTLTLNIIVTSTGLDLGFYR
jgi:hypothetical protein